jgi:hypothetical protein
MSRSGERLLARMRASKADWSAKEVLTVYRSLGFTVTEGRRHTRVQHPRFPWLLGTIRRSDPLPTGYIETLLELEAALAGLLAKEQRDAANADTDNRGSDRD